MIGPMPTHSTSLGAKRHVPGVVLLRGNVMLVSILILLAVLLGFIMIGMTLTVGNQQGDTVAFNKALARQASTACLEMAMDKIGRNSAYTGDETISITASTSCLIRPVVSSTTWTIEAEAVVANERSRERVVLSNLAPVTIQSWAEVASF